MGFMTSERIIGATCDGCGKSIAGELVVMKDNELVYTCCNYQCAAKKLASIANLKLEKPVLLSTYLTTTEVTDYPRCGHGYRKGHCPDGCK